MYIREIYKIYETLTAFFPHSEFFKTFATAPPGGEGTGILPIVGYTGRLRPKGVPLFSSQ